MITSHIKWLRANFNLTRCGVGQASSWASVGESEFWYNDAAKWRLCASVGSINICSRFHGTLSNIWWDISVKPDKASGWCYSKHHQCTSSPAHHRCLFQTAIHTIDIRQIFFYLHCELTIRLVLQTSYRYLNKHLFWGTSSFVTSAWMNVALLWWPLSCRFFSTKLSMKSTAVTCSALVSRCLV